MSESNSADSGLTNAISRQAKNFFSLGATGSLFFCAATVEFVWKVLRDLSPIFETKYICLALALILVYGLALVIPEPEGYPNAGKRRITIGELIFGAFNTIFIYAIARGLQCL
jgi:hypothetical protein